LLPRQQRGTLAQLVEQRTFNPLVTSSNLVRPTNMRKGLLLSKSQQALFSLWLCSHHVAAHASFFGFEVPTLTGFRAGFKLAPGNNRRPEGTKCAK
jgi:hypothetical protein